MTLFETLTVGGGFLATFSTLIGYAQNQRNKVESLEAADKKHDKGFEDVWSWKNAHEKDSFIMRESFQRELLKIEAKLDAQILVNNQQFIEIKNLLTDIKSRIEKLEDRQRRKE